VSRVALVSSHGHETQERFRICGDHSCEYLFIGPFPFGPPCSAWNRRQPITGTRSDADAKPIENFQRSRNIPPGGTFAEMRFGPQRGEFLSNRHVDELVEGPVFRLDNTTEFFQKRRLKNSFSWLTPKLTALRAVVSHQCRIC
jgi:hypothetical protein